MRLTVDTSRDYTWEATYQAHDGSSHSRQDESTGDAVQLPAHPPSMAATQRTVRVIADAVDWSVISRVAVKLRYYDPVTAHSAEGHLLFTTNSPPTQSWQFTAGADTSRDYTWEATYQAHDGSSYSVPQQTSSVDVLRLPSGSR